VSATELVDDTPRHLTAAKGSSVNSTFSEADLGEREWLCKRCKARVTQTADRSAEYGHHPKCEHSIRRRDDHALNWRGPMEDES
jgi:uncharacterized paraquat-inducible protein A